jgi:hypothetical protein
LPGILAPIPSGTRCKFIYGKSYILAGGGHHVHEEEIAVKLQKLPENAKREVIDYLDFLLSKYQTKEVERRNFRFGWEGGLAELRGEFNSVDLQHKASEWR